MSDSNPKIHSLSTPSSCSSQNSSGIPKPVPKHEATEAEKVHKKFQDLLITQIYRENSVEKAYACIQTLLKVLNNILNAPTDMKFRKLPMDKPLTQNTLRKVVGGVEFLIAIGFRKRVVEFKEVFILEIPKDDENLWKQTGNMEIAKQILEENLNKAKERKELKQRMEEKERLAEAKQKEDIKKAIEADREERARARERLLSKRQLEKEKKLEKDQHEQERHMETKDEEIDDENIEQEPADVKSEDF